jgi:hypothetical protein
MLGFKYFTESEALFAKRVCDEAAGFPVNPDNITTDAVSYHFSKLDAFYYILASEYTAPLGTPIEFTITNDESL